VRVTFKQLGTASLILLAILLNEDRLAKADIYYTFTTITDPNAKEQTDVKAINNNGQILGTFTNASGTHVFVDTNGSFSNIPFDSPPETSVAGFNDAGQIVGWYTDVYPSGALGASHAYIYANGMLTSFDFPGAADYGGTQAYAINDLGQIVGSYADSSGAQGFLYSRGTIIPLNLPFSLVTPTGINDKGEIVGQFGASSSAASFVLANRTFSAIQDPNATQGTYATGINDNGEIVGYFFNSNGPHGFIDNSGAFTTINDPFGTTGTYLLGINDSGELLGSYTDRSGSHGFVAIEPLSSVPEPRTLPVLTGCVAVLTIICHRRLRSPNSPQSGSGRSAFRERFRFGIRRDRRCA
jgi:probable HAF family extracellular repeat protein